MRTDYNEVFVDVVDECQQIIRNLELDGASADDVAAVEKAIDMAIERRHSTKPKELFLNDVLRNGRFSVRRSRARERNLIARYAEHQPRMITGKARVPGDFIDPGLPQAGLEARELFAQLHEEAKACGEQGVRVLQGLLAEETTATTARGCGVSPTTVNRTIGRLRSRVKRLECASVQ